MIWDIFMYGGERDMLNLRLAEMGDVPGIRHVAVQGTRTFRGEPRELTPTPDKVLDIVVALPADEKDAWANEKLQRNSGLGWGLPGFDVPQADDIVLVCDVDEIPRAAIVKKLPDILDGMGVPIALPMRMHYWGPHWVSAHQWYHPKAAYVRDVVDGLDNLRMSGAPGITPVEYGNCGWHLSWFGGEERCHDKLRAFSHSEFDTPAVHDTLLPQWIEEGRNMHGEDLKPYDGNDWPKGWGLQHEDIPW